jgi:ribonuclease P protein component
MTIKSLSSLQIASIMKKGKAYNSGFFLLKTMEEKPEKTGQNNPLLIGGSFISSKKVFIKAVDRNRSKRRLKEAFLEAINSLEKEDLKVSIPCFVVLSKLSSIKADFSDIVYDMKQILLKDYIIR